MKKLIVFVLLISLITGGIPVSSAAPLAEDSIAIHEIGRASCRERV